MELNGVNFDTYFNNYPDKDGYFGKYGGVYIDDKLKAAMAEITEAYFTICKSSKFIYVYISNINRSIVYVNFVAIRKGNIFPRKHTTNHTN